MSEHGSQQRILVVGGVPACGCTTLATGLARLVGTTGNRTRAGRILVDGGSGPPERLATLARSAGVLVLVATPDPAALIDTYALLKLLTRGGYRARTGLVVSLVRRRSHARRAYARFAETAQRFLGLCVEDFGYVRWDPRLGEPAALRELAGPAPDREVARLCYQRIAQRITGAWPERRRPAGFWPQVAALFL